MVTVAILLAFAGWPMLRVHLQSVAVLDLVGDKPVPSWLRRPIAVQDLQLPLASGTVRARLYTPLRPKNAPAIIVLHGVHHLGIDEPAGEFCNLNGLLRYSGADTGATGYQGLPGRRELNCNDWGVGPVVDA
jgi:hypothetical protein